MSTEMTTKEDNEVIIEDLSEVPLIKQMISQSAERANGFIRLQPYNQVFPPHMKNYLKMIRDFPVHENDVWISTFPKSGTTWTQEMVWCIMNDMNLEEAKKTSLDQRVPFFEVNGTIPENVILPNMFDQLAQLPHPRIIKTHLIFDMLPKECAGRKLIYVVRNPRDVCYSLYNHYKVFKAYEGTFDDFAELFLNDLCYYAPYTSHVKSYWSRREDKNILILTYEDMKTNLSAVIKKVATFLQKELSDENIENLQAHLAFDSMKVNNAVNKLDLIQFINSMYEQKDGIKRDISKLEFMRKGEKGGWKEHIKGELLERFKKWEDEGFKDSDIRFTFD